MKSVDLLFCYEWLFHYVQLHTQKSEWNLLIKTFECRLCNENNTLTFVFWLKAARKQLKKLWLFNIYSEIRTTIYLLLLSRAIDFWPFCVHKCTSMYQLRKELSNKIFCVCEKLRRLLQWNDFNTCWNCAKSSGLYWGQ